MAFQQIASKEAERHHLQNQLRSLEGSSSSSTQQLNPNPITSPTSSPLSTYRPPPESPFVAPKHTMQPIYVAPPTESYLLNLPSYMQPLSPPEYRPQKAKQSILLNQHLYDMFSKQYHHVIKPRYAEPEPEPLRPKPKPKTPEEPPDPTIGASSKPGLFVIDPIDQPNPIFSFLKTLTLDPQPPEMNPIESVETSGDLESDSSLELMMQEAMHTDEPQVEHPPEPPPFINPTQPR